VGLCVNAKVSSFEIPVCLNYVCEIVQVLVLVFSPSVQCIILLMFVLLYQMCISSTIR
jgi:hypothetical protein